MHDSSLLAVSRPRIITWRLKVHPDAYSWLNQAAIETNLVWNYCAETAEKALCRFAGKGRWLTGLDLCNLTAGSSDFLKHIGSDTVQRICTEYAQKRNQTKKVRLRWRRSFGSRRSLGWIPFRAASLRRHGKYLRFCGKTIRFFEAARLLMVARWHQGCFAQDAVGDWYLCLTVQLADQTPPAQKGEIGIDLGLKDIAVTSDADRLTAGLFYRSIERKIVRAQRQGHRRQARRLHRKACRRRLDALHKFSRSIVNVYQTIFIGDVSIPKLARTRMGKAVLDSGWGMLRTQFLYKGEHAGRCVRIVDEYNTTRACSTCGALTGPSGVNGLRVRSWICPGCGAIQDRDVNAARNICFAGRMRPSEAGNGRKV